MTAQKLYTIGQAADELGISPDTLRRWEARGKIKPGRTAGGQRIFDSEELITIKRLYLEKAPQEFVPPAIVPAIPAAIARKTPGQFLVGLFSLSFVLFL